MHQSILCDKSLPMHMMNISVDGPKEYMTCDL